MSDFYQLISSKKLTVVDFGAKWCGPCQIIKPWFNTLPEEYPGVQFEYIDVDEEEDLADQYKIDSVPCFIFFVSGKEVARSGNSKENIINKIVAYQTF